MPRQQPKFQRLTFRHGIVHAARFAPDANTIVYTADWVNAGPKTFAVRLDSPEFHPTVLENAKLSAVSSAGELAVLLDPRPVAFQTQGTLARVPFSGGAPREVLEHVEVAEWSPKGELAIVRNGEKDNQLEFPMGKVLFHTAGYVSHVRFSPAGDRIAFLLHPQKNGDNGQVMVVDLAGEAKTLSEGWGSVWGLAWMPKTNEVCFTATQGRKRELHAVTLKGVERTILAQTGNLTLEDIARDGRVLLNSATQQMKLDFVADDPKSKQPKRARDLSWLDWSLVTDISSDGKALTFFESGEGAGDQSVAYYRKVDGSAAIKLGVGEDPSLSPDGKSVAVVGLKYDDISILPVGPGEVRRLPPPGLNINIPYWLPDGKELLFVGSKPGHGLQVFRMGLDGNSPRPVSPEGLLSTSLVVIPDGSGFAAMNGNGKVLVYSLAGGEPRVCLGIQPDERPYQFTADGALLYVLSRGAIPAHVYRVDCKTGRRELWREIQPADAAGVGDISGVRLTPDGKSYAYSYVQELSELHLVEGLK